MLQARPPRSWPAPHRAIVIALALGPLACGAKASAQYIAIGAPSFQSGSFPSMETLVLDRLAVGGQYNPGDLATLSHLTVLESIAMLADIQADMPNSVIGVQLQAQVRELWDAAALFEESVSVAPLNLRGLSRVAPLYNNLQAAYQDVESTLAASAGLSSRTAAHLRDITSLMATTSSLMRAIESNLVAAVPIAGQTPPDMDRLKTQARLLADGIVALIENVKATKHEASPWSAVIQDLQHLFMLVQGFERTLATQPSNEEIKTSLHAVRRRLWQVEARIARIGWPSDLERKWRDLRARYSAISDELGLPRVIDLAPQARAERPAAASPSSPSQTRIYRGPP